jgi:hypothetical protein
MHPLSQLQVELVRFANQFSESFDGSHFLRAQALAIGRIGVTTIPRRSIHFSVNPYLKRIRSDPAVRFLHMDLPPMWQTQNRPDLPRYSNQEAAAFQPQWLTLMMHGLCDPLDVFTTYHVADGIASLLQNAAGVTFWFLAFNKDCVLHLHALVSVLRACLPRIQAKGEIRCILQFTRRINGQDNPNVPATDSRYPQLLGEQLNRLPTTYIQRIKIVVDFVEYADNLQQVQRLGDPFKAELKKHMWQTQDWVDTNVRVEWRASAQEAVYQWLQFPNVRDMNLSVYWPYKDYDHLRTADTYPRASTIPRTRVVQPAPDLGNHDVIKKIAEAEAQTKEPIMPLDNEFKLSVWDIDTDSDRYMLTWDMGGDM